MSQNTELEFIDAAALSIINGLVSKGQIGFDNEKMRGAADLAYRMAKILFQARSEFLPTAPVVVDEPVVIAEAPQAKEVEVVKVKEVKAKSAKSAPKTTKKKVGRPKKKKKEPELKVKKLGTTSSSASV